MKLQIMFKTPGALVELEEINDEDLREEAEKLIRKYVRYSEYVTLEFDTEAQTARVLEK